MHSLRLILSLLLFFCHAHSRQSVADESPRRFRAVLHTPGGALPFILDVQKDANACRAWIVNGPERIEIPEVRWGVDSIRLGFDHYDSWIDAQIDRPGGEKFEGVWKKCVDKGKWATLKFSLDSSKRDPRRVHRFRPLRKSKKNPDKHPPITGRWKVRFSRSDEPAVGIFDQRSDGNVVGTFLTTTGDYRFLAGCYEAGRLRLSCFDGAHAFLFDASIEPDGSLKGDFQSRDTWHETWTATRDDEAALPDGFRLSRATDRASLEKLKFHDLSGTLRSPADPAFAGKVRIIEVFGSWCPNCHDASAFIAELDRKYRSKGLSVLGLAFEITGEFDRDARQVRRFIKRHGIEFPILLAGLSDKKEASKALPFLDRVRAYPTTLFMKADGTIQAVYTGFSGPATGEEYQGLRRKFEKLIETMLADPSKKEPEVGQG